MTVPRRSASSGNSRSSLNLVTEKSAKKKDKKSAKRAGEQSVMGNLRATRPSPIGARRTTAGVGTTESSKAAKPATTPSKRSAGEKAATTQAKATKPAAAKSKAKAARPAAKKPAKRKAAKPTPGKATVKPTKRVAPKSAGKRVPPRQPDGRPSRPPRGSEIVTTAVQAAGELAQIGATVGAQWLRRAGRRISRPSDK